MFLFIDFLISQYINKLFRKTISNNQINLSKLHVKLDERIKEAFGYDLKILDQTKIKKPNQNLYFKKS